MANTAQRRLAEEVTRFVHGEEGLAQALKATAALAPGAATTLDADSLEAIAGDAPSAALPREQLVGAPLADVMVAVGMQPSKAAVRRMIKASGGRGAAGAARRQERQHAGLPLPRGACPQPHLGTRSHHIAAAPPAPHRPLQGGGVRVNNEKVDDELHTLSEDDLIDGRLVLIAAGKKNKMLVRVAA